MGLLSGILFLRVFLPFLFRASPVLPKGFGVLRREQPAHHKTGRGSVAGLTARIRRVGCENAGLRGAGAADWQQDLCCRLQGGLWTGRSF
jgi:hypothetical protein